MIVGNAYAPFYRVNSVFWDPSIYGRFLVVAILACLVLVLRGAARWVALGAAAAIVGIWIGLVVSFSQSSFFALIVGVFLLAAFAWRWKIVLALGARGRPAHGRGLLGAAHPAHVPRQLEDRPQQRDERPLEAHRHRRPHRARQPAEGRRRGQLQARVREAEGPEGRRSEERRVARHAGDGRRRDRACSGSRCSPGSSAPAAGRRSGACRARSPGARRSHSASSSWRSSCTASSTTRSSRTR